MYFTKYTLDQRKQNDQPAATFDVIHYGTCTKRHCRWNLSSIWSWVIFFFSHQILYIKLFKVIYIYLSKGPIHHLIKYKNTDSESWFMNTTPFLQPLLVLRFWSSHFVRFKSIGAYMYHILWVGFLLLTWLLFCFTITKSNLLLHLRLILFQYFGARKRPFETKHLGVIRKCSKQLKIVHFLCGVPRKCHWRNIWFRTVAMEKQWVGRLQENSWVLNGNTSGYAWTKPQERQPHPWRIAEVVL